MGIGNQFNTNIYQYIQFLKGKHVSLGSMLTKNVEIFDWASFKTKTRFILVLHLNFYTKVVQSLWKQLHYIRID